VSKFLILDPNWSDLAIFRLL